MKSKPIKKIGDHIPKAFLSSKYATIQDEDSDPQPFDEDEVSSTGTNSLSDDDMIVPMILPTRRKKIPEVISILHEEDDFRD